MTRLAAVLSLAGIVTIAGGALAATVPTVAVVRGDLLGGAGPETAQVSEERYRAVCEALEAAGIPYRETSDTLVERWGLPDVPVAILPYNRAISDEQLRRLRAFLDRPARLIVFYPGRPDLVRELGATPGSVVRELFAGQFHSMSRVNGSVTGLPPSLALEARVVRELASAEGGLPVYSWRTVTGDGSGTEAVIVSERGALIGAPPASDQKQRLKLLLRALIGHYVPQTWAALAPSDPRRIGPVGHHGSLADFSAALQRATGDHLDGSRSDVREAGVLLNSIPDLLAEGKQDEAIAASRRAGEFARRAWFRSYPSESPEIRGVWASNTVHGGWDDALGRLKAANFNLVLPYMASGAAAYYPSNVLPAATNTRGNELAAALQAGRKHGIAVHPRILGLFTMGATPQTREELRRQGRIARYPQGHDDRWLCPSNHQNRAQIIQTAVEMVTTYGAEGVQFDYLRYGWTDRCICTNCRSRFQTETGITVSNWPRDVLQGAHKERWLDWRRELLDSLLRTTRQRVKEARPDAVLSASVFLNWESHRNSFGQDWKRWCDDGLVDFVAPMTYVADMEKFQDWVRKQREWAGPNTPLAMGIGPFADINPQVTPQGVLDQIQASRRLGCDGFVLFNYQAGLASDYLPLLSLGATSTAAEMPSMGR